MGKACLSADRDFPRFRFANMVHRTHPVKSLSADRQAYDFRGILVQTRVALLFPNRILIAHRISAMFCIVSVNVFPLYPQSFGTAGYVHKHDFCTKFIIFSSEVHFRQLVAGTGRETVCINRIVRDSVLEGVAITVFENIVEMVRVRIPLIVSMHGFLWTKGSCGGFCPAFFIAECLDWVGGHITQQRPFLAAVGFVRDTEKGGKF